MPLGAARPVPDVGEGGAETIRPGSVSSSVVDPPGGAGVATPVPSEVAAEGAAVRAEVAGFGYRVALNQGGRDRGATGVSQGGEEARTVQWAGFDENGALDLKAVDQHHREAHFAAVLR